MAREIIGTYRNIKQIKLEIVLNIGTSANKNLSSLMVRSISSRFPRSNGLSRRFLSARWLARETIGSDFSSWGNSIFLKCQEIPFRRRTHCTLVPRTSIGESKGRKCQKYPRANFIINYEKRAKALPEAIQQVQPPTFSIAWSQPVCPLADNTSWTDAGMRQPSCSSLQALLCL